MTVQKVTLSIDAETYQRFQIIKKSKGLSISAWVTSLMQKEIEEYQKGRIVKLASGIEIAEAMYSAGMRLDIIKEKLLPVYGNDIIEEIMKQIKLV